MSALEKSVLRFAANVPAAIIRLLDIEDHLVLPTKHEPLVQCKAVYCVNKFELRRLSHRGTPASL